MDSKIRQDVFSSTSKDYITLNYLSSEIDIENEAQFLALWETVGENYIIMGNTVKIIIDGKPFTSEDVFKLREIWAKQL